MLEEDGGGGQVDELEGGQASYGEGQLGYNNTQDEDGSQDTRSMADGEGYTGAKVCSSAVPTTRPDLSLSPSVDRLSDLPSVPSLVDKFLEEKYLRKLAKLEICL